MISPQFRPLIGGYERAAERLAMSLADRGHEVLIVAERRDRKWPKRESVGKAKLRRIWCVFKRGVHKLTSLSSLGRYLLFHGWKFDVWHVHQYGDYAGLTIALSKLYRRPVVLKLTSSGVSGLPVAVVNSRFPKISSYFHRQVDAVCATSEENYREAVEFGIPAERIHRIGNGVDIQKFAPRASLEKEDQKRRLGLANRKIALFVGRLHQPKNAIGIVEAWELALPELDENWDLVIVGEGPERGPVENFCRERGITSRVKLVGHHSNVDEWLSAADLFVLPSWFEGLSNALLEAMACGLSTVSTAVSGSNELVAQSGTGITVPIGDMRAFSKAIVELASDDQRREAGGAIARQIVEQRYSLPAVTLAYDQLYQQLTQPKASKAKARRVTT